MDKLIKKTALHIRVDEDDELMILHIGEAIAYFKTKISEDFDISADYEQMLICNRVRYAYSQAVEDFEINFLSDLITLQVKYAKKTDENI